VCVIVIASGFVAQAS